MTKTKPAKAVERDEKGRLVFNFAASEASENWLRYGRLKELADKGDEEARKECEGMDGAKTFTVEEE